MFDSDVMSELTNKQKIRYIVHSNLQPTNFSKGEVVAYKFLIPTEIQEACKKYLAAPEEIKKQIKMFEIFAHPDLDEGRFGPLSQGFVLVRDYDRRGEAPYCYKTLCEELVMDFCYRAYGSRVAYGMGGFIVSDWKFEVRKRADWMIEAFLRNPNPDEGFRPETRRVLLGVIEPLNIPKQDALWDELDFYKKIGWQRY